MMKNVWINKWGREAVSISFSSKSIQPIDKLHVTDRTFPAINPINHTINIGIFSRENLKEIVNTIQNYLDEN